MYSQHGETYFKRSAVDILFLGKIIGFQKIFYNATYQRSRSSGVFSMFSYI